MLLAIRPTPMQKGGKNRIKTESISISMTRTPAAVSGYHSSSAKLAFWIQCLISSLL